MKWKLWQYPLLPFYYLGKLVYIMSQDNIFGQKVANKKINGRR